MRSPLYNIVDIMHYMLVLLPCMAFSYGFYPVVFQPVTQIPHRCFASLVLPVTQECRSWSALERAPVLYHKQKETLYFGGLDRNLHAWDLKKGRSYLVAQLDAQLQSQPVPYEEGLLLGFTSGRIGFFSLTNKHFLWETLLDSGVYSTPVLDNEFLYVLTSRYSLYKINPKNGQVLWAKRYGQAEEEQVTLYEQAGLQLLGPHIVFGTSYGELKAVYRENGEVAYTRLVSDKSGPFQDVTALAFDGADTLYASSYAGGIVAFGAQSGLRIFELPEEEGVTQMLYQEGKLFAASAKGFLLSLDPSTGKILWKKKVLSGSPSPLMLEKEILYAGSSEGPILVMHAKKGDLLQRLGISGTFSRVLLKQGHLYGLTKLGFLAVYKGFSK